MTDKPDGTKSGRFVEMRQEQERFEKKMAKIRHSFAKREFDITSGLILDGLQLLLSLELCFREYNGLHVQRMYAGRFCAKEISTNEGPIGSGQTACEAIINLVKEMNNKGEEG